MEIKNFIPNLIPNNPKDGSFDRDKAIMKNGGYDKYVISYKKDGCRLEIIDGKVLTRALKTPGSKLVVKRFQPLANLCKKLNISIEGEFYQHGLKFNQIFRYFSKSDVTDPEYKEELLKELDKNTVKFEKKYETTNIEELTTFGPSLCFWLFDGIVLDRPDLIGFEERMNEIICRLGEDKENADALKYVMIQPYFRAHNKEQLENLFQTALKSGWEGLVLVHENHSYKFGRNTLNEGTFLKVKNDALLYDGVVLDVLEGTNVKKGINTTVNELGRSRTSKKKGDRELSGIAKGFLVQFKDLGTFVVGLRGFDVEEKENLLLHKADYIGKAFSYTAMAPVKDFPRHAYFKNWRDSKI